MKIILNGEPRTLVSPLSLAALLAELGIPADHLAIEHNGEFIADDADFGAIAINPNDKLEIVRFVGGG